MALALASATLAGCSTYKDPTLVVTDAKSIEESDAGLSLAFTLTASNTNDVALPLRAVEYQLELSDDAGRPQRVFRGVRSPEASVRRLGEQQVILPAVIPLQTDDGRSIPRPTGVRQYSLWTRLTYVTPGAFTELLFDTGVRRPVVSITQTGALDFGPGPGSPVTLAAPVEH